MVNLSANGAYDSLYSVAAVRAIDRAAIEQAGIAGYTLMTRAASAALEFAQRRYPHAKRWQILCGGGNNGGDGYVLAKLAAERGLDVGVIAMTPTEALKGDALKAFRDFETGGGRAASWSGSLDNGAELLVDALLGSGLDRNVEGRFADAVTALNDHGSPILALDVPSGLNADTGAVLGVAVAADATVTFVGRKTGLHIGSGPEHAGCLEFASLHIPSESFAHVAPAFRRLTAAGRRAALPPRPRESHKGAFGHVVIVGGGPGMPGAAVLAATAALRAGAGRVSVATHPGHAAAAVGERPEIMWHGAESADRIASLLEHADVVAVGPGLGLDQWALDLFTATLALSKPLVVDADALTLLARTQQQNDCWVLTPHPGEAARLLGVPVSEVQTDRRAALDALTRRYGGTVLLKGAGTLIGAADDAPWMCTRGNPGMASPGMGDVLTGVVAALRAQGLSGEAAAVVGADVHAGAADDAAEDGQRGLLAMDVVQALRSWVNP